MYQIADGMGSMDRSTREMTMPMGPNSRGGNQTGGWNGQSMEQAGRSGNDRQTASDIFGAMPGSMQGNMTGGMSGNMPGNMTGGMSGNMPGGMTGSMSGNMTGNMSGNMPAGTMNQPAHTSTPAESGMRRLDLDTGLSPEAIENPTSLLEAQLGSLRSLLSKLVGHYIIATFLIGTQNPVSWEGFLYNVGNNYIVIFQPDMGRYVTGDMFSLKFVEFYEEKGVIPPCIGYRRRDSQNMW